MSGRAPRTPGTPSIIMSPDLRPWTQIRLGAGTRNVHTCAFTGGRRWLEPQRLYLVHPTGVCGGSPSASRSFVRAALRALHLDPDGDPPNGHRTTTRPNQRKRPTDPNLYGGPQHR